MQIMIDGYPLMTLLKKWTLTEYKPRPRQTVKHRRPKTLGKEVIKINRKGTRIKNKGERNEEAKARTTRNGHESYGRLCKTFWTP